MSATIARAFALVIALVFAQQASAEIREPEIYADFQGIAIRGYDTVAYFTDNQALRGSPQFQYEWNGAVWYFTSAEHRDMFAAEPARYAPQFGGYCAWGVYKDSLVRSNPEVFSIVDGKLFQIGRAHV